MYEDGMTVEQANSAGGGGGSFFGRAIPSTNTNTNSGSLFGQATPTTKPNHTFGATTRDQSTTNAFAWGQPQQPAPVQRPPAPQQQTSEASRQRLVAIEAKMDQMLHWREDCTRALQYLIDAEKARGQAHCTSPSDTRGHDYAEQPGLMQCQRCGKRVGVMPVSF
jgi:hypothetical protein